MDMEDRILIALKDQETTCRAYEKAMAAEEAEHATIH
jgi:hypothetical protein